MEKVTTYINRGAKVVYHSLYNVMKTFYDYALDPVKFEELREMTFGEGGREVDRMLEEYRQRKRQTAKQNEDTTTTETDVALTEPFGIVEGEVI